MAETNFPLYRAQEQSRISANNAMMAILAGSRLASHTLQLTEGSTVELGKLFPAVEHIERFNLKSDSARTLLRSADHHIASVAIPYALAVHEAFVLDVLQLACNEMGRIAPSVKAWNMHEKFFDACGASTPGPDLEIFHVLRELRNCIIHSQGVDKTGRLATQIGNTGADAKSTWERLNSGTEIQTLLNSSNELHLEATHIFTAFATSKSLARQINTALTHALPVENWARIALQDFDETTSKPKNSSSWRRSAKGYLAMHYAPVTFTNQQIEDAARRNGLWSANDWE